MEQAEFPWCTQPASWQEHEKSNEEKTQDGWHRSLIPWQQQRDSEGTGVHSTFQQREPTICLAASLTAGENCRQDHFSLIPSPLAPSKERKWMVSHLQTNTTWRRSVGSYLSDIKLIFSWVSHHSDTGLAQFLSSPPKPPCLQEVGSKSIFRLLLFELEFPVAVAG